VSAPAADKQVPAVDRRCKPPRADPSVCLSLSLPCSVEIFFSFLNLFPSKDGVRGSVSGPIGRLSAGNRDPMGGRAARYGGRRCGGRVQARFRGRAGGGFVREFGIFVWFGLDWGLVVGRCGLELDWRQSGGKGDIFPRRLEIDMGMLPLSFRCLLTHWIPRPKGCGGGLVGMLLAS
jgi:hypothetical protein